MSTVISDDGETFNVVDPVLNDRGIGQRLWTVGAIKAMMMVMVRIVVNQRDDVIMVEVGRAFIDVGRARGRSFDVSQRGTWKRARCVSSPCPFIAKVLQCCGRRAQVNLNGKLKRLLREEDEVVSWPPGKHCHSHGVS